MADAHDSKSCAERHESSSLSPGTTMDKENLAYVIGVALGDGNLSNPNGRAVRLRITCDARYKNLIERICLAVQKVLPRNKVSLVDRTNLGAVDVSCYSNEWENLLGWKAKGGSKHIQGVSIPRWIKQSRQLSIECLRGLLETDGSIYEDRGYLMVNFVTVIPNLAEDVMGMISELGFQPHLAKFASRNKDKYTVRISKHSKDFIKLLNLKKD